MYELQVLIRQMRGYSSHVSPTFLAAAGVILVFLGGDIEL